MKPVAIVEELEAVCKHLGIDVSYETLSARVRMGGLCRVKGRYRVIIEKRATPQERATTLAEALGRVGTGDAELSSGARGLVDVHRLDRAS